jgi:hypothetical protein
VLNWNSERRIWQGNHFLLCAAMQPWKRGNLSLFLHESMTVTNRHSISVLFPAGGLPICRAHTRNNSMTTDLIREYQALRAALEKERSQIQDRLKAIDAALAGGGEIPVPFRSVRKAKPASKKPKAAAPAARGGGAKRIKNKLTLREAITQVTKDKALTRREIVDAVQKVGFRFASKDPMNSLGAFLYTHKSQFKNEDGKWRAV